MRQIMPFRFDPTSQKVVDDSATANTQNDLEAHTHRAPTSSHGGLAPAPGISQSKIPAGKMDKSRQRTTLGQKLTQPEMGAVLKRGFIIIGLIVIVMTGIIYAVSQQFNHNQKQGGPEASGDGEAALTLSKGKKLSPLAMHQFLIKVAARAVEEGNHQAGARLYGHAAEEARLGGPALNKQYIDAIFAEGEVYQYSLSDSAKARPLFEKVLKAQQADATTKPIKLANTYNDLADSLSTDSEGTKERIPGLYQKAISLAKSASDTKGHAYYCFNAGDFYFDVGQYDKALSLAKESLANFAKLKDADLTDIADSHYLAARSLGHMPGLVHFEAANSEYEAALKTYEKAETDEDRYANCMRDAAWNKLRVGQRSEAKELFDKASNHTEEDDEGQSADSYMNDALK
jgi:tetratricopeptide (TPR) repeat protein